MSLLSSTLFSAADASQASAPTTSSLVLGANDIISQRAVDATTSGMFPVEVAFVVLGCLVVTSFALLIRESTLESKRS